MKPTEELSREHEAILRMIAVLADMAGHLETGTPVDPDDLERSLEFIRVFADKCHHAKEEDLLFPAMEKAGIPRERGPIGVMLAEHERGRKHVQAMAKAIPGIRSGDQHAAAAFAAAARAYGDLLSLHIAKEDRVLYPLADSRLTDDQQAALEKGFVEVEETVVGHGVHEEFHRLLDRLEKAYHV
jgi:hemerythrin-like domain-containing protein